MLTQIYIKNFKAFEKKTINISKHNMIIGENDAGKTSLLMALDIFFNKDENYKIEKAFIRDTKEDVEIGIWFDDKFYKKIYSPATFKLSSVEGDLNDLSLIKYIYIPIMNYDPKKLITQLAASVAINNTDVDLLNKLKQISQVSVESVINTVDNDLLVIDKTKTNIVGKEQFKYENAIKFDVSSDGIPIESRGSGFQKNLMYALLVGAEYSNVILAIDEIENSLSVNNCNNLIVSIQKNINQTLITTHSKEMLKIMGDASIVPIYNGNYKTLSLLISSLDDYDNKTFLLVEGKYDLPWYKKVINILGKYNEYILLPSGGSSDADHLKEALVEEGKKCIIIKDGDTDYVSSLEKDCIELYVPLWYYKQVFNLNVDSVPDNKKDFFDMAKSSGISEDGVKKILANHVDDFLDEHNPLVEELSNLLSITK